MKKICTLLLVWCAVFGWQIHLQSQLAIIFQSIGSISLFISERLQLHNYIYIVTWGNHSTHFFPLNRNKQFVFLLYISVRIVCCIFAKYRPFRSNYTGVVCSLGSVVCWWRWETGNKNKALSVVFSTLVVCMWFLHNQIYRVSGFILQPATQLVM